MPTAERTCTAWGDNHKPCPNTPAARLVYDQVVRDGWHVTNHRVFCQDHADQVTAHLREIGINPRVETV